MKKKKNLAKKLEDVKDELSQPIPEPQSNEKEKGKMATKKKSKKKASAKKGGAKKKVSKKKGGAKKSSTKKSKKGASKKTADGGITLKALADEAGISGQAARQKLRAEGIEREEGGRWSWKEGSKALKQARKALGL